jgi:hypothetical protein
VEHLARLGQPEPGPAPLEERHPQLPLEGLELQADRGLAQQEVARRRGDARALGHGAEDLEVMEVHVARPGEAPPPILGVAGSDGK